MQIKSALSPTGVTQLHVGLTPGEKLNPADLAAHIPAQKFVYQSGRPGLENQFLELVINDQRKHIIEVHLAMTQQEKAQLVRPNYRNGPARLTDPDTAKVRRAQNGLRPAGKNLHLRREQPDSEQGEVTLQRLSAKPESINGEEATIYHSYAFAAANSHSPQVLPTSGDLLDKAHYVGSVAAIAIKNGHGEKGAAAFAEIDPQDVEEAYVRGGTLTGKDVIAPAAPGAMVDDLIQAHGIRGKNDTPLSLRSEKTPPLVRAAPDGFYSEARKYNFNAEVLTPYAFFSVQAVHGDKHIIMSRVSDESLKAATLTRTSEKLKDLFKSSKPNEAEAQAIAMKNAAAGSGIKAGRVNNTALSKLEKFASFSIRHSPEHINRRGYWDYQAAINQAISYRGPTGNRVTSLMVSDKGLLLSDIFDWYRTTGRLQNRSSLIDVSCKPRRLPTLSSRPAEKLIWGMADKNLPRRDHARMWQGTIGAKDEWSEITNQEKIADLIAQLNLPDK